MKEYLLEVSVKVDDDEIEPFTRLVEKEKQIRRAIEGLDPSIGIFQVENFQES